MYKVECPYCEEWVEIEYEVEDRDRFDYECSNCEKEFEVGIEWEPNFAASEIVYKICDKCGKETRKHYIRNNVCPYSANEEYNILCLFCYHDEISNIFRNNKRE